MTIRLLERIFNSVRIGVLAMDNDFDSVSWQNESEANISKTPSTARPGIQDKRTNSGLNAKRRSSSNVQRMGSNADAVDLGGIGDGKLECSVDIPLKENDGTKDAYISYLVSTQVRSPHPQCTDPSRRLTCCPDGFQVLSKVLLLRSASLYRLCVSLQNALKRVSCLRSTAPPGQTQNGICPW